MNNMNSMILGFSFLPGSPRICDTEYNCEYSSKIRLSCLDCPCRKITDLFPRGMCQTWATNDVSQDCKYEVDRILVANVEIENE